MKSNARCWTPPVAVLAIATSWLGGCATGASDLRIFAACPPVVEYSREFQASAAEELALLPKRSAIVKMMRDYAVMRDQAQACAGVLTQ